MSSLFRCDKCKGRAEEIGRDTIDVLVKRECEDYDCKKWSEDCTECFCNEDKCEEYRHDCEVCDAYNVTEARYVWNFYCKECDVVTTVTTEIDRY